MFEKKLFDSLRSRVPWPVTRLMFMQCGLQPSLGWDSTISIFQTDKTRLEELQKSFTNLKKLYVENLHVGNKAIIFFELEKEIKLKLLEEIQELEAENSLYRD